MTALRIVFMTSLLIVLAATHWKAYIAGAHYVRAEWALQRAADAQQLADATTEASRQERAMQTLADKARQDKQNEINRLNRLHAAVVNSLRHRPERPNSADMPTNASHGQAATGCTGTQLYREDADFLAGEAQRADRVRVQLMQCQTNFGGGE